MQFLILAYDGTDEGAMARRMQHREAHLAVIKNLKEKGNALIGAPILDDNEKMIGSVLIVDFPDRAAMESWLHNDPYVTGKVWDTIKVERCTLAPSWQKK